jgi:hypothetical protein
MTNIEWNGERIPLYFRSESTKAIDSINQEGSFISPNIMNDNLQKMGNNLCNSQQNLLLIPPLHTKIEKNNYIAVSLALLGWNVFGINPVLLAKWANPNIKSQDFISLLKKYRIQIILVFDYAFPIIMQFLQKMDPESIELLHLKIICFRPTISYQSIQKLWQLVPFSEIWWSRCFLSQFLRKNRYINTLQKASGSLESGMITYPIIPQIDYFFIHPSKTWLTTEAQNQLTHFKPKRVIDNFQNNILISQGGWTFYGQETIILGWIAAILSNFKKNNDMMNQIKEK